MSSASITKRSVEKSASSSAMAINRVPRPSSTARSESADRTGTARAPFLGATRVSSAKASRSRENQVSGTTTTSISSCIARARALEPVPVVVDRSGAARGQPNAHGARPTPSRSTRRAGPSLPSAAPRSLSRGRHALTACWNKEAASDSGSSRFTSTSARTRPSRALPGRCAAAKPLDARVWEVRGSRRMVSVALRDQRASICAHRPCSERSRGACHASIRWAIREQLTQVDHAPGCRRSRRCPRGPTGRGTASASRAADLCDLGDVDRVAVPVELHQKEQHLAARGSWTGHARVQDAS